MRVTNINIMRFRNLHGFKLELSSGVNLFFGENGHGKTNLLEAVTIILNGTTPRASKLAEVIPHDGESARWSVEIDVESVHHTAECIIQQGHNRRMVIDGQARKKLPGPSNGVYVLTFFPEDFKILTGEPYFRRRFIDEAILLTEPKYASILKSYKDAHDHRNSLIKTGHADDANLRPFEELLAKLGIEITTRRANALIELDKHLDELINGVFESEISIRVEYQPSFGEFMNLDNPVDAILESYRSHRKRDIAMKRTTLGPHRDEIAASFSGEDIRKFSSRGETRLAVVALIIAKYHMFKSRWDLSPVVILDDIFSELDQSRRVKILDALPSKCQLMITAVDRDLSRKWLKGMKEIRLFNVHEGQIQQES